MSTISPFIIDGNILLLSPFDINGKGMHVLSVVAIYSALAMDKDMDVSFLLSQDTKQSPKKNAFPLVLF